jgi:hypothetical protein
MKLAKTLLAGAVLLLAGCGGSTFVDFTHSAQSTLDTGDNFANGRYYEVWEFAPVRSGTATFGMNSPDFLSHLEIEDENGNVIADNDHEGRNADSEISAFLSRNQNYFVIATTAAPDELGDYEMLWEDSVDLVGVTNQQTKVKPTFTNVNPAKSSKK